MKRVEKQSAINSLVEQKISPENIRSLEKLGSARVDSKVQILLVALGLKQATVFSIDDIEPFCRKNLEAELKTVKKILSKLGLTVIEGRDPFESQLKPILYIARDYAGAKVLSDLWPAPKTPEVKRSLGKLFGYPESAVEAYSTNELDSNLLVGWKDLPDSIKRKYWSGFIQFKLSKNNWEKEIETPKKWAEAIRKLSPDTFRAYLDPKNHAEEWKPWSEQWGKNLKED